MKVLVTGGAGFLGQKLANQLLSRGSLKDSDGAEQKIEQLILVDVVKANDFGDSRVKVIAGDIADPKLIQGLITPEIKSIFHLAAIVSGQAEADFDLGMRINLDAARLLLEACRKAGHKPKIIFTSSVAVYGGALPEMVLDTTALNPQSSYGTQKAICELLLNDFTRKGFVDGRVLRLPTISVRPGVANKAASSFASGIIREPLNGQPSICPVSPDLRIWLLSPLYAIESLITGHDLDSSKLGLNKSINLPGVSVSVGEMIEALHKVASEETVSLISIEPDPKVEAIVRSWPASWDASRAQALGLKSDPNFQSIVEAYIEDELKGKS
ncbi:D-erythronate dehydrogenase [Polynucleobacter asymbioticus]|uniref:NAD-dependent epimerase/dehydratase n=1 Tax=Polynucleobacter asymbioticus (strain DSM 18221 / CIP 109841 / QLW-P1DMWA-1) TaxID=312153 RepID=A4SZD7_POLAQ|nr:D-erythronate dehydrogenase [Polynucleobacter asymbioticus]ABP34851.1 NAD-dependent epimerase/dehydratase [Polynucleobacter asymbioticus QLW-P1DMWA-1]